MTHADHNPSSRLIDKATRCSGQTWPQAVDVFAEYYVSPPLAVHLASAIPTSSLPRLLKFAGSSAVLSSLWNALTIPASPSAGALDRFAAILALSAPEGRLLELFLVQFLPQAQANLSDSRLSLLEDVVGRVLRLAVAVDGRERIEPFVRALEVELRGPRFSSARTARNGVLGAVERVVGVAA